MPGTADAETVRMMLLISAVMRGYQTLRFLSLSQPLVKLFTVHLQQDSHRHGDQDNDKSEHLGN
jgi:hypothetical protein